MTGMMEVSRGQPAASAAAPLTGHAPMAGMDMGPGVPVSGGRKAAVTLLTLLMLAVGYRLAARYGDLSMRPGGAMGPMPGMAHAAR